MATLCSVKHDIIFFSEQKEYTLIPTLFLNHLVADSRLIKGAANLWQILFNFAKGNKELATSVRYKKLADILGKSTKTIIRYVQSLKNAGYLGIQPNYRDNGGKSINTFYLQIPPEILNQLQKAPDRRKNKTTDTTVFTNTNPIHSTPAYKEDNSEDSPASALYTKEATSHENVLRETLIETPCEENDPKSAQNVIEEIETHSDHNPVKTKETSAQPSSKVSFSTPCDSFVTTPCDRTVTTINNNLKEILNNNSAVVVDQFDINLNLSLGCDKAPLHTKISAINNEIATLEKQETDLAMQSHGKGSQDKLSLFQQRRKIAQTINTLVSQKDILQAQLKEQSKVHENNIQFEKQISGEGPRQLAGSHAARLEVFLQQTLLTPHQRQQLRQEIIYAIRFGSLVHSCQNKQPMSLGHSLNIALKLVKEGRWERPMEMNHCLPLEKEPGYRKHALSANIKQ